MKYKVFLLTGLVFFTWAPHTHGSSKKKKNQTPTGQEALAQQKSPTDDPGCWGKKKKNGKQYQQPPSEQTSLVSASTTAVAAPSATPSSAPQTQPVLKNNHYATLKPSPRHMPKNSPRAGLNTASGSPRKKAPPPPPPARPSPTNQQGARRRSNHHRSTRTVNEQLLADAGLFSGTPSAPAQAKRRSRASQESIYASLAAVGLADPLPKTPAHGKHASIYIPAPGIPELAQFFTVVATLESQLFVIRKEGRKQKEREGFEINERTVPIMEQLLGYIDMHKFHMAQKKGVAIQDLENLDQQSHMYRLAIHNYKYSEAAVRAIAKNAIAQMQRRTFIEELRKEENGNNGESASVALADVFNHEPAIVGTTSDESHESSRNSRSSTSSHEPEKEEKKENEKGE